MEYINLKSQFFFFFFFTKRSTERKKINPQGYPFTHSQYCNRGPYCWTITIVTLNDLAFTQALNSYAQLSRSYNVNCIYAPYRASRARDFSRPSTQFPMYTYIHLYVNIHLQLYTNVYKFYVLPLHTGGFNAVTNLT